MTEDHDGRREVSPYEVRVDPALVGNALATPWRRALAISIDGLAIAVLANAPSVFLGIGAAFVLLRVTAGSRQGGLFRRGMLRVARYGTAIMAFVVAARSLDFTERIGGDPDDRMRATTVVEGVGLETRLGGREGLLASADLVSFALATDPEDALRRAQRLRDRLGEAGLDDAQILALLDEVGVEQSNRPWLQEAVNALKGELGESEQVRSREREARLNEAERSLVAYARAFESGDSATADSLRQWLAPALVGDSIERLDAALRRERTQSDALESRLRAAQIDLEEARAESGLRGILRNLREDLGLGLGWSGLYFTAFTVLWRGKTPGKRLMGIRVVRVDGKPLGWWASFERFGGYAAGFATGLLGFLQIFWDRNRQAVHDKISETVVVRG